MKEKVKYLVPAVVTVGATTLPVWASSGDSGVTSAMTTAITTIASDALSVLPLSFLLRLRSWAV